MQTLSAILLLFLAQPAAAPPPPPGTDIWLLDLDSAAQLSVSNPRNLTHRPGYDNQPAFSGAGDFLFTSIADGQADAWRYPVTSSAEPLLQTPESEYSPTPTPSGDISVVRVALDGTQQLWSLAPGAEKYELLFPLIEGIGYHAWLDEDRVALFIVKDPSELHVANRRTGKVEVLAKDIGRSLVPVPGESGQLAFTETGADGKRWIKQIDVNAHRIVPLAPLLEGSEDFAMLPDGRLLMAQGKSLFTWQEDAWRRLATFSAFPGGISRLAVSHDATHLALVVDEAGRQ